MASRRTKVVIIFYSLYTHTWQLAQAIADGASEVEGVDVEMYQVPELLPPEVINKMGASQPKEAMKDIPIITPEIRKQVIKSADALVFGSPTRFGSMTAQMKMFFDGLGGLWFENACVGKIASCFTGSGNQHGGQETTIMSMLVPLLHLGFIYAGLPYSCAEQKETNEVSGGTPYGSSFIAASDGSRAVSANEKACARYQGKHVATLAKELKAGRIALHGSSESSNHPEGAALAAASASSSSPDDNSAHVGKAKETTGAGATASSGGSSNNIKADQGDRDSESDDGNKKKGGGKKGDGGKKTKDSDAKKKGKKDAAKDGEKKKSKKDEKKKKN